MKTINLLVALGMFAATASAQKGFVPLFDGKDLRHWQTGATNWAIENGTIALKDRDDGREHNDNYLWTKEEYGDFVLELEFKAPPDRANSGVFLRTSDIKDPVYSGIELQVGHVSPGGKMVRNSVGGLYDLVAPLKDAQKPGQWNKYVVTCVGPKITVMLNGEPTAEADLDQWTETGRNPDGSRNKFRKPVKDFARKGYIGLQDHGLPVWYRNIRIRRLDSSK
jgi:hypothetical protein